MPDISEKHLKQLEEDLGYIFSTPQAEEFQRLLAKGEGEAVCKMLLDEGLDEAYAKALYTYLRKKYEGYDLSWMEIDKSDIKKHGIHENYLFRVGQSCVQRTVTERSGNRLEIYGNGNFIDVNEVDQVWLAVRK